MAASDTVFSIHFSLTEYQLDGIVKVFNQYLDNDQPPLTLEEARGNCDLLFYICSQVVESNDDYMATEDPQSFYNKGWWRNWRLYCNRDG